MLGCGLYEVILEMLQAAKMLSCWENEVIVTSSVMPSSLAKALLEGGAKAVICREGAAHPSQAVGLTVDFFATFYRVLLSGRPIVQALAHAGGCPLPLNPSLLPSDWR